MGGDRVSDVAGASFFTTTGEGAATELCINGGVPEGKRFVVPVDERPSAAKAAAFPDEGGLTCAALVLKPASIRAATLINGVVPGNPTTGPRLGYPGMVGIGGGCCGRDPSGRVFLDWASPVGRRADEMSGIGESSR